MLVKLLATNSRKDLNAFSLSICLFLFTISASFMLVPAIRSAGDLLMFVSRLVRDAYKVGREIVTQAS